MKSLKAIRSNKSNTRRTLFWLGALSVALGAGYDARADTLKYSTTFTGGPDSGTPSNFTAGGFTLGNTLGTVTSPVNSTSASSGYTIPTADGGGSASAGNNLGTAAVAGALNTSTSSYYTFTLTPTSGYTLTLTDIDFGVRSTNTGPTGYALYSSADSYGSALYTGTVANNSTYVFKDNASFTLTSTTALTLRLYVYGGTATAQGTETNRLDDIIVQASAALTGGGGGGPTVYQYFDLNTTTAGSGIASNSTNTFSGAHFNSASDGTGSVAAFTNDGTATATFSAGTDSAGKTYTVNIDTAVMTNGITFNDANVTLAHATGGSLTLTGASINVAGTNTATISESIASTGTIGLTKNGTGTLTLTGVNNTTGSTTINSGILSVGSSTNLPSSANGIVFGGGTLQTKAGMTLGNAFTGTGLLDIAPGTTLASTGVFNTTGVTLSNTGTLDLQGSTPNVGNLAFTAAGTLASTTNATVSITGLTASGLTSGVATVSAALTYASQSSLTTSVGAGGELDVTGPISTPGLITKGGNVFLAKTGAGTLDLYGNNSALFRVELGSANATTTPVAGTLNINNNLALGANQFFFNAGTLDATTPLTGGNAISVGVSLGALSNAPAVFNGSNVEFTGPSDFFESTATTPLSNALTVNNTTVLSGALTSSSKTAPTAASLPVLITGTGTLRLTAGNTFSDPLTLSGGVTLEAAATGGSQALGGATLITANAGGTLLLSTPNQVNPAAALVLNTGAISLASGANQGSGATRSGGVVSGTSTVGLGALTLQGNSTLLMNLGNGTGAASTAVFASFDPTNGGTGTYTLNVSGNNFATATDAADGTNNRLIFNEDIQAAGFLGDITFNGNADAAEVALDNGFYEIFPSMTAVPEPGTVFGGVLLLGAAAWRLRRAGRRVTSA